MKAVTLVFVGLLAAFAAADPFNCTAVVTAKSGAKYEYNLTSLFHEPQFSDSLYYQGDTGDLTYINLCGDTTTTCSPSSPVCRRAGLWSTMGYGELDTQQFYPVEMDGVEPDQGVTVKYKNGEFCPQSTGTSSVIHIICGKDEAITSLSLSSDGCTVTAVIKSQAGCGVKVGTAAGETVAIVILCLLLAAVILYIAIGMLVNWKVNGAQTIPEMIPNKDFWVSVPGLIVDGCKFIGHGFKKGDYVSL